VLLAGLGGAVVVLALGVLLGRRLPAAAPARAPAVRAPQPCAVTE
jgi:hypothetical protein